MCDGRYSITFYLVPFRGKTVSCFAVEPRSPNHPVANNTLFALGRSGETVVRHFAAASTSLKKWSTRAGVNSVNSGKSRKISALWSPIKSKFNTEKGSGVASEFSAFHSHLLLLRISPSSVSTNL
jgi:hypothetical protein